MYKSIARNISTNWICYFISFAIGMFLSPFVIHRLGVVEYGIWVMINTFIGYFCLMDIGISSSIIRYVSIFDGKRDRQGINEIISTSTLLYLFLGILAFLVSLVSYFFISSIFKIPPQYLRQAQLIILIVGANFALAIPMNVFSGLLRGINRFDVANYSTLAVLIIRTIGIVYLLQRGYGLVALAAVTLLTNLVGYVINIIFSYIFRKDLKISIKFFNYKAVRMIFSHGLFAFIIRVADRLIMYTDRIVIGIFLGPAFVTFYSIGNRLVEYMREFISEAICVVGPSAGFLYAQGDNQALKDLTVRGTKYVFMLSIIMGAGLILLGRPFLNLWMGAEFARKSTPILIILASVEIIACPLFVGSFVMRILNKHRPEAYVLLAEALLNLALSLLLLKRYGMIGVAIGTAIPFVGRILFLVFYVSRILGLDWKTYVRSAIIPPLRGACVAVIPFILVSNVFVPDSYAKLAAYVFFMLCVFGVCNLYLSMSRYERALFFAKVRERLTG